MHWDRLLWDFCQTESLARVENISQTKRKTWHAESGGLNCLFVLLCFKDISVCSFMLPVSWNVEIILTFQQSKNKSCRSWCMYSICFLWTVTNKDHISPGERGGYEDRSRGCVTKTGRSAEETDKNRSASSESVSSTEGFLFHSSWPPGCHTSLWIKDSMAEYILSDFQKVEKFVIVKLS